jgi:hypothetical protein
MGNAKSAGGGANFGSQDGMLRSTTMRKKVEDPPVEGFAKVTLLDENGNEYFERCL